MIFIDILYYVDAHISLNFRFFVEFCHISVKAHNPKVTGSSPVPATKYKVFINNGLVFARPFFYIYNLPLKIMIQTEEKYTDFRCLNGK